ncbi:MAG TPA: ATP-binding protein [Steroidobacteraceae bacterium]|nr:ATP-binding protein [Steroidobacteraceae bacterium]
MSHARVRLLLAVSILVMAMMPLITSFYLLENALRTSLNLGFNAQIVRTLDASAGNLRRLGKLDPQHGAAYRAQFEQLEELRQVYADPQFLKQRILGSMRWYFGLGLGAAVLLSMALAALLSRQIARSHARNLAELMRERDKVHYLQEMSSWQELARMLAHEIKNPLTPIEVLVTSLSKACVGKSQPEFLAHLERTQLMIGEELQHLKATVGRFSEFARLPQVQLESVDLVEYLSRQARILPGTEDARLEFHAPAGPVPARVDSTLFRQVLANLVRNAIEANAGRRVNITWTLERRASAIELRVANDGAPVDEAIAPRMFDPYVSSKSGKDNMGLGLAIVKKIVLEHGGEIRYAGAGGSPAFVITLPVPP